MNKDQHFDKTYYYVVGTTAFVLIYVIMITFLTIPKENQRFVDISLAFLLGFISGCAQYLTGGTPAAKVEDKRTTTEITPDGTKVTTEPVAQTPIIQ